MDYESSPKYRYFVDFFMELLRFSYPYRPYSVCQKVLTKKLKHLTGS